MSQSNPSDHQPQPPQDAKESKETLEAKTAFTASLRSVGLNYETELRERARNLHDNAAAVEKQENELRRTTAELAKQNESWMKVADQARDGLKEIGDVQNWAELIERDLLVVEETIRLAEEREREEERAASVGREEGDEEREMVVNGAGEEEGIGKGKEKGKVGWFAWW